MYDDGRRSIIKFYILQIFDNIALNWYIGTTLSHHIASAIIGTFLGEQLAKYRQYGCLAIEQFRFRTCAVHWRWVRFYATMFAIASGTLFVRCNHWRGMVVGSMLNIGTIGFTLLHTLCTGWRRFTFSFAVCLTLTHGTLLWLVPVFIAILFRNWALYRRSHLVIRWGNNVTVFGTTLWAGIIAWRLPRVLFGVWQGMGVPQITLWYNKIRF